MDISIVTVPHSQKISSHSVGGSSYLPENSSKGSAFLSLVRYLLMGASHLSQAASGKTATSLQQSLRSGGAIETIFSGEEAGHNFVDGLQDIHKTMVDPQTTMGKVAKKVLIYASHCLEKTDSLLYTMDTFGVPDATFTNSFHGTGYLASMILAIKNYIEVKEGVKDLEEGENKDFLVKLRQGKFATSAAAATVGLFALVTASSYLAMIWVVLALGSATLSIADVAYEGSLKQSPSPGRNTPPVVEYV